MTNIQKMLKIPTVLLGTALLATSCAAVGATGEQGPVGPQGPQGIQGPVGPAGAIGSTGPAGAVGPAGPAGSRGPAGPAGSRGPAGTNGTNGTNGAPGLAGDSAYDLYVAEYPGYAAASPGLGLNASQWIKDLAANTLYPTFTLDYTGQTEFNDNFTQDTSLTTFRAYKGQSLAQFPLIDLFATLTPQGGSTQTRAQYLFEFYSNTERTTLIPSNFVYNVTATIYVKATRIGVESIVLKNETNGSDIVATGNSKDGFALTVPLETVAYSNKFTHYLATANAAIKTDGKIYSNSAATTEFQSFLVMRDGATGTGSNLTSDLLDIDDAARLSFGIWQNSGDAVPPGGYLSFATAGTFTVYLRVYFDAVSFRIVPLAITVTNQAAASIVAGSTTSSLTEAAANDGSLTSPTVTITILNGVLADPLVKADVTAANLPAGMDFTLVRTSNTVATVTITGSATNHANANDVSNLNFTIARAKVTGAIANLVTPNISINFNDPNAPSDTTAPVLSFTSVDTITTATASLIFTSDEAGTYYYLVLAATDTSPNAATIKAQGTAVARGTGSATATSNTVTITGLAASTTYKVYLVVEDAVPNISAVSVVDLKTIAPTIPNSQITQGNNLTHNNGVYSTSFTWSSTHGIGSQNSQLSGNYYYYSDGAYLRFQVKNNSNQVVSFDSIFNTLGDGNNSSGGMTLQTNDGNVNDMDGSNRERYDWGVAEVNAGFATRLPNSNELKYIFYGIIQAGEVVKTVGFNPGDSRTINMTLTPRTGLAPGTYTITVEVVQQGGNVLDTTKTYTFVVAG